MDTCGPGRRNNDRVQATTRLTRAPRPPGARGAARSAAQAGAGVARVLGALGLVGIVAMRLPDQRRRRLGALALRARARRRLAGWLAGPLPGLGIGLSQRELPGADAARCAPATRSCSQLARRIPVAGDRRGDRARARRSLLLGPPLLSQDVFGYIAFARMGALHGLDPYTHFAAEAPTDPVFTFVGWPFKHSPYGPLFTLASYATAPLGLAGGLWALKAARVPREPRRGRADRARGAALGHSARWAAAFVGLNPVLLVLAVGGAHNDTLVLLAIAGALALSAGAEPRLRAGAPRSWRASA